MKINFANIANQVKFIVTLKYYQQSLSVLVTTMTDQEEQGIKKECEQFIKNDTLLNYLLSCKSIIAYEMITIF